MNLKNRKRRFGNANTLYLLFAFSIFSTCLQAQDDLLQMVEKDKPEKQFVHNAFKSTRVINNQSVELLGKGVLDVRILHRFGPLSTGLQNLFGLDQANMRFGFDYGISKRLMAGFGRSNVNKELDGFIKYKPVWQATGPGGSPVSVIWISGMTYTTMPWIDPTRKNYASSRMAFYHELIIGRKFNEHFSLQMAPLFVHRNLTDSLKNPNDSYALAIGARYKLSNRVAIVADYTPIFSGAVSGTHAPLGIGVDIETGGHVFQLHFTNATGMNEKAFLTDTHNNFFKGEIRFGFNLSRVFTIVKPPAFRTER